MNGILKQNMIREAVVVLTMLLAVGFVAYEGRPLEVPVAQAVSMPSDSASTMVQVASLAAVISENNRSGE